MAALLAVVVVLVLAPASFAQVSIQLITDPSPGEINTNHHAQTANLVPGAGVLVSGSLVNNSSLSTTTLTITYPVPITSQACQTPVITAPFGVGVCGVPSEDPIRIEGQSGLFANVSVTSANVSTSLGTVTLILPACNSTAGCSGVGAGTVNSQGGTFRLVGVRIDENGKSGAQSISASLNNSSNNYILTTSSATIQNGSSAGISAINIGSAGTASLFTNRSTVKSTGSFTLTEGCASCWRTAAQSSNSNVSTPNGSNIRLTFNNVPAGVTLTITTLALATSGGTAEAAPTFVAGGGTITTASNTATIQFNATNTGTTEVLTVTISISNVSSTATLSSGSITVTATMAPVGDAFDSGSTGLPTETGGYPRFTATEVGPITVVSIIPANTVMLVPYVLFSGGIDTGIEVANTTADPFGGTSGGGATATNGTLTFNFFPTSGTGAGSPVTLTTSATNRLNSLDANGNLVAGSVLAVNTSQLLTLAGATGSFQGYVFITANFLNAHGIAFMSDYKTFFMTVPMFVLPPPASNPRNSPFHTNIGNGAEALVF